MNKSDLVPDLPIVSGIKSPHMLVTTTPVVLMESFFCVCKRSLSLDAARMLAFCETLGDRMLVTTITESRIVLYTLNLISARFFLQSKSKAPSHGLALLGAMS